MRCLAMSTWALLLNIQSVGAEPSEPQSSPAQYQDYIQRIRRLEGQDRAAALVELEHARARFPEWVGFHMKRCELLLDLGQNVPARHCLEEVGQRFPALDADWSRLWSRLCLRVTKSALHPEPATSSPKPTQSLARRWWVWTALGVGVATASIGLVVGLVPRAHDHVEWQP